MTSFFFFFYRKPNLPAKFGGLGSTSSREDDLFPTTKASNVVRSNIVRSDIVRSDIVRSNAGTVFPDSTTKKAYVGARSNIDAVVPETSLGPSNNATFFPSETTSGLVRPNLDAVVPDSTTKPSELGPVFVDGNRKTSLSRHRGRSNVGTIFLDMNQIHGLKRDKALSEDFLMSILLD
jgi:hypothetical protein